MSCFLKMDANSIFARMERPRGRDGMLAASTELREADGDAGTQADA